jgi:hypothetical protein
MTNAIRRMGAATLVVAALCVFGAAAPAFAQTTGPSPTTPPGDTPSVGVTPTESHPDDPNNGQWFVFQLDPGGTGRTEARIGNPATIPLTVKLYLADLVFGRDGTPTIPTKTPTDIGAWGKFDQDSVTIQPGEIVRVGFTINVPADADPGDHVGAVVAEQQPEGGRIKIIKRIATRLYVTVPGDATKSFSIARVTKKLASGWWPRSLEVTTLLRNTGRVRLETYVSVNGVISEGAEVLLARSVERYVADVRVPWYGGPVKARVKAVTETGTKEVSVTLFVIPWALLAMIPVAVVALAGIRKLWRMRKTRIRGLREDLRRLEKLVTERQTGEAAAMANLAEQAETIGRHFMADDPEAERIRNQRDAAAAYGRVRQQPHAIEPEPKPEPEYPPPPTPAPSFAAAVAPDPAPVVASEPEALPEPADPEPVRPSQQAFADALADFLAEQPESPRPIDTP